MQIIESLDGYERSGSKPLILALGNFDGFHLGHQKILEHVREKAKAAGGVSGVFTFKKHPQGILHPQRKPQNIYSLEKKKVFLKEAGIDLCILTTFTHEFSKLSAEDFVRKILIQKLNIHEICMGYNAYFGRGREGDSAKMKMFSDQYGFEYKEMPPVLVEGEAVSSSRIRELVRSGCLEKAGKCLGRPFALTGRVIKGDGRGRTLDSPTANLQPESELFPPRGVYLVGARFLGEHSDFPMKGLMNLGKRPTFEKSPSADIRPEIHFLDFKDNLYNKMLEVVIYKHIRDEMDFENAEALKAQIRKDIGRARDFFGPSR